MCRRREGPQVRGRRGPRSAGGAGSRRKWLPGASLGPKGPAELRGGLAGLGRPVSEGQEVRGRATSRPWTWGVRPHSLRRASEQSTCPPRLPHLLRGGCWEPAVLHRRGALAPRGRAGERPPPAPRSARRRRLMLSAETPARGSGPQAVTGEAARLPPGPGRRPDGHGG